MRALRRAPRRVVVPLAVLALAGAGFAAYGATGDDAVSYRTVAAATGDVEQTLDLSGVIGASGRSDLAFGTDGEVARVPVAVGDEVEQGQVIAVLDRASLRAAVDRARSDLASAKARLADDEDAQAASVSSATTSTPSAKDSSGPSGSSGSSGSPTKGATPTATTPVLTALTVQQDAVTSAQSAASSALEKSTAALATQEQACRATATPTADASTDDPTDDPSDDPTDDPTDAPGGEPTDGAGVDEACTQALAAVQSAQSATAQAQQALQDAISTLTATLTAALGDLATGSGAASAPATSDAPTADAPAADTPSSDATPSDASSSRTVTAATLADDQASIDKARSGLATARADLEAAVVRAPAAGTVTSLSVARGEDVSSGDTVAVVVAPGVTTVFLEVTETQAAQLRKGTAVEATPSGATDPLAGEISRVSNVPTSSDSASDTTSDPTYAVDVTLDERDLGLPEGLPASVAVVVGSARDAVTVPASAVSDGTVTTLVDGRAERVRVTTGIVGSTEVEIVDGIEAGTRVVLADLDADLPSSDGQDQQRFGGGFGGDGVRMGPPGGSLMIRR